MTLLQALFVHPLTSVEQASQYCDLSYKAANELVAIFKEQGYLTELTGQNRNRIFSFTPYLKAFEGK